VGEWCGEEKTEKFRIKGELNGRVHRFTIGKSRRKGFIVNMSFPSVLTEREREEYSSTEVDGQESARGNGVKIMQRVCEDDDTCLSISQ
jgi:hypothetical protein